MCLHEWENYGTIDNYHNGDVLLGFECVLCGEDKTELVPAEVLEK